MEMDEPVLRVMERIEDGGRVVLTVQGEVDIATVDALESRLVEICARKQSVTVDLRRVTFLDCLGVRLLLEQCDAAAAKGCRVDFIPGPPAVRRVLELTGALERLSFVEAGAPALHTLAAAGS